MLFFVGVGVGVGGRGTQSYIEHGAFFYFFFFINPTSLNVDTVFFQL